MLAYPPAGARSEYEVFADEATAQKPPEHDMVYCSIVSCVVHDALYLVYCTQYIIYTTYMPYTTWYGVKRRGGQNELLHYIIHYALFRLIWGFLHFGPPVMFGPLWGFPTFKEVFADEATAFKAGDIRNFRNRIFRHLSKSSKTQPRLIVKFSWFNRMSENPVPEYEVLADEATAWKSDMGITCTARRDKCDGKSDPMRVHEATCCTWEWISWCIKTCCTRERFFLKCITACCTWEQIFRCIKNAVGAPVGVRSLRGRGHGGERATSIICTAGSAIVLPEVLQVLGSILSTYLSVLAHFGHFWKILDWAEGWSSRKLYCAALSNQFSPTSL